MNRAADVHTLVVAPMRKEVVKKPKRRDLASISGFVEAEFVGLSKRAQAGVPVPPGFFTDSNSMGEKRCKMQKLINAI